GTPVLGQQAQINAETFSQLELGYALPTGCGPFSPDGNLMSVSGDGLYDLTSGRRRFPTQDPDGFYASFSPDGRLMATIADGLYDTNTGEKLLGFSGHPGFFSPDGTFLAVNEEGLYDVASRALIFRITQFGLYPNPIFSPDGTLLAAARDGVYDLITMQKLYTTEGFNIAFSPDSLWLLTDDGVYDAHTGELRVPITCNLCLATVSQSGTYLAIDGDGVYKLPEFARLFDLDPEYEANNHPPVFSPDETLLVSDAVYRIPTGEYVAAASVQGEFNTDGSRFAAYWDYLFNTDTWETIIPLERYAYFALGGDVLAVGWDAVYNAATGEKYTSIASGYTRFNDPQTRITVENHWISGRYTHETTDFCLVYGLPGTDWPYRSGLVHVDDSVNLRSAPNPNSPIVTTTARTDLPVFAVSPDGAWLKVAEETWVANWVVEVISLPPDLPVEDSFPTSQSTLP
ncbi:MAG: hypothetical protein KC519_20140, partial [Anaerolineae bacterium]|nr:hypothetical protein [Anaerolineae bacterium]